jgi:hypothetical protein
MDKMLKAFEVMKSASIMLAKLAQANDRPYSLAYVFQKATYGSDSKRLANVNTWQQVTEADAKQIMIDQFGVKLASDLLPVKTQIELGAIAVCKASEREALAKYYNPEADVNTIKTIVKMSVALNELFKWDTMKYEATRESSRSTESNGKHYGAKAPEKKAAK